MVRNEAGRKGTDEGKREMNQEIHAAAVIDPSAQLADILDG